MQSSHRFTLKLLSLLTSSKPLFSSGVTKEAAFPGRQLWDSRKVMTLAKVLTQLLVQAGDWALCSHSSSFEALALISELSTAVRSHPASAVGLHRQILCSFFSTWPSRHNLQRQQHLRGLLLTVPAWQQLGNAQWGWHGQAKSHLPSNPPSLLAPGKAQRAQPKLEWQNLKLWTTGH